MIDAEQLKSLFSLKKLSETEQSILEYIANNVDEAVNLGATGIAQRCYTSPTSVVRVAKKLGFNTSREMLYELEHINNAPSGITFNKGGIYLHYNPDDLEALFASLGTKGTIGLSGQGYSQLVTNYLEKKLKAFGCMTLQQDDLEPSTMLDNFCERIDALICISKSGETAITCKTARLYRQAGVPVIAMTGNAKSTLAHSCDALFVVRDECPFDIENVEPNYFFGYCILAFEEVLLSFHRRGGPTD